MKPFLMTLISLLIVILITSCGNSHTQKDVTPIDSDSIKIDTAAIIAKQREDAKKRDSLPQNCTAEQAIEYMKTSGYWAEYSQGIIPDLVNQHLPYAQRLINNTFEHFIIVDKNSMMVVLYDKYGRRVLNYKMACGRNYGHKRGKADCRTPEGYFLCQGKYDSTDWLYTNDWGVTSPVRGQFGPRFIRVCPQIGIHGTGARYSIGRRCSHGCIRIQNENILELYKYAKVGMPIIVNPGPNDINANKKNGVKMPAIILPDIIIENPQAIVDLDKLDKKIKTVQPPTTDSIKESNDNSSTTLSTQDSLKKINNSSSVQSIEENTKPESTIQETSSVTHPKEEPKSQPEKPDTKPQITTETPTATTSGTNIDLPKNE